MPLDNMVRNFWTQDFDSPCRDPAICLLCGALLCCGSDCCKDQGVGECSQHAAEGVLLIQYVVLFSTRKEQQY